MHRNSYAVDSPGGGGGEMTEAPAEVLRDRERERENFKSIDKERERDNAARWPSYSCVAMGSRYTV